MEIPFRGKKHSPVLKVLPKVLDAGVVNTCSPYLAEEVILTKKSRCLKIGKENGYG
jgi:hypothetical protein